MNQFDFEAKALFLLINNRKFNLKNETNETLRSRYATGTYESTFIQYKQTPPSHASLNVECFKVTGDPIPTIRERERETDFRFFFLTLSPNNAHVKISDLKLTPVPIYITSMYYDSKATNSSKKWISFLVY